MIPCEHKRRDALSREKDVCLDCGQHMIDFCRPCPHKWATWGSDARFQKCIWCPAMQMVAPAIYADARPPDTGET